MYRDDVDEMVLMMMLEMPNMVMVLVIRLHLIMPSDCKLPADTGKLPDDTDDDASVHAS